MSNNLQIFKKLKYDWDKVLNSDLSLDDLITANKFQAHLLHCTALVHGLYIDVNLFFRGLSIEKIITNSTYNGNKNSNSNVLMPTERTLSLYFYCDSLAFRRGSQPVNSKFTYPFAVKKLIESENLASTDVFLRGRGGLTFVKLPSIFCTDIGYFGSLFQERYSKHYDVLIFQLGLVDYIKFKSSKLYKLFSFIGLGEFFNNFVFKHYFIPKIERLFIIKKLLNINTIMIFFSIGYNNIANDHLLIRINNLIKTLCLENDAIFINTELMVNDDYIDEGHLTEVGHFKYAKYIKDALTNRLFSSY